MKQKSQIIGYILTAFRSSIAFAMQNNVISKSPTKLDFRFGKSDFSCHSKSFRFYFVYSIAILIACQKHLIDSSNSYSHSLSRVKLGTVENTFRYVLQTVQITTTQTTEWVFSFEFVFITKGISMCT